MALTLKSGSLLLAVMLMASPAGAQTVAVDAGKARALFEVHECAGCHQVDTKVVGPALKQVAEKYRGDKEAASRLLEKVKKGGAGVWGEIPMPPHAGTSDDELKVVIAWILAQ